MVRRKSNLRVATEDQPMTEFYRPLGERPLIVEHDQVELRKDWDQREKKGKRKKSQPESHGQNDSRNKQKPTTMGQITGNFKGKCNRCKEIGHKSSQCPKRSGQQAEGQMAAPPEPVASLQVVPVSVKIMRNFKGKCHRCKEIGHKSNQCLKRLGQQPEGQMAVPLALVSPVEAMPVSVKCFRCGGMGHYVRACTQPYRKKPQGQTQRPIARALVTPVQAVPINAKCFRCGGMSHYARTCTQSPQQQPQGQTQRQQQRRQGCPIPHQPAQERVYALLPSDAVATIDVVEVVKEGVNMSNGSSCDDENSDLESEEPEEGLSAQNTSGSEEELSTSNASDSDANDVDNQSEVENSDDESEEPEEERSTHTTSDTDPNDIENQSEPTAKGSAENIYKPKKTLENSNRKRHQEEPSDEQCSKLVKRNPTPDHVVISKSEVGTANVDSSNKYANSKTLVKDVSASEEHGNAGSSGKRRRSRWEPRDDGEAVDNEGTSKRRKSRWECDDSKIKMLGPIQLPDFLKELAAGADSNPEIREMNMKLFEINRKLQGQDVLEDQPEQERSSPVFDSLGNRTTTGELMHREMLIRERQDIISKLIQKNPTFKPPSDYKPPKHYKKLYIPVKEFPDYNFIGLIIGPRGNALKRMEKMSGAKIFIRGRGSEKKESNKSKRDTKPDPSADNDDLHILVEADNQKSLDAAVGMLEKLLIPVDDSLNDHKRSQLRELAEINGKLRNDCTVCGEQGHKSFLCPNRNSKIDVFCWACGESGHPPLFCPMNGQQGSSNLDPHHQQALSSGVPWTGNPGIVASAGYAPYSHTGIGPIVSIDNKSNKEIDDANLYVGYLPPVVDDDRLIEMFSPFGRLLGAKVIKDKATGLSKGYGFVKYSDPASASKAVVSMNGHKMDGKMLAVRVAGRPPPPPVPAGFSLMQRPPAPAPAPAPAPLPQEPSLFQSDWPGPPGSMLPEPQVSFPNSNAIGVPPLSGFLGQSSFSGQLPSSYGSYQIPISSSLVGGDLLPPVSVSQFPGNLGNMESRYESYYAPSSSSFSLLGTSRTRSWSSLFPPERDTKAVESEYEKFMSEMA